MSTVIYVAIVEGNQDEGYSAFFPDLDGCVAAAESMLELPSSARDALSLHLQGMLEDGEVFPEPTALEEIKSDPDVKEVGRLIVDVDVEDAPVRVNISIGAQFLKRVDVAAEARGMSRSGFLVEAARAALDSRAETLGRYWLGLGGSAPQATSVFEFQNGSHIDASLYAGIGMEASKCTAGTLSAGSIFASQRGVGAGLGSIVLLCPEEPQTLAAGVAKSPLIVKGGQIARVPWIKRP